ncbi:MAG: ABC transporter substrate-binding protein [Armatimonadota bacterium]|nr:ABC transporter substrate-binding protein [Armatimonadota bacterium]MDR7443195.1 ABC transporter substrate-binding protein [Armatimonadota bacterium]MDR7571102.1 ABC transporter substrate-binding protein [Armatimonadota bacterium]MDR7614589.1 ABC transporter substrate-binding protein [Armatimonadota bacterium]
MRTDRDAMRRMGTGLVAFLATGLLVGTGARFLQAAPSPVCPQAQQGGRVRLLTLVPLVAEPVAKVLETGLPGLRVEAVADLAGPTRVITEAEAGRWSFDVMLWSLPGLLVLAERGLLAELPPEELSALQVPAGSRMLGNRILRVYTTVYGLGYNRQRIRPEEVPKTWDEIAQPRWSGRVVGNVGLVENSIAGLGLLLGEGWMERFARRLRDEVRITVVPNPATAIQMILRGERDLWWSGIGEILERREKYREPIDWSPVRPTYGSVIAVSVLRGRAENAVARCAAMWMAGAEGKRRLERETVFMSDAADPQGILGRTLAQARLKPFVENVEAARKRVALAERVRAILQGRVP